jgi:hypothetical protein
MSGTDADVLAALKKAGSRLDQPHPLRHYLYVPDQAGANAAASALRREGFEATVERAAMGNDWVVLITHQIVPSPENVAKTRTRFEQLAKQYKGEYDGWEAGIVRGPAAGA